MTVPVSHTFTPGPATSSEMNAYVRDPLTFLFYKPLAELRQTVAQTGLVTSVFTAITFTTEDLDSDPSGTGGHSTSSNTSRFTAVYPGRYRLSGAVAFANNATGSRGARFAKNGTAIDASATLVQAVNGNVTVVPARQRTVYLVAGDYVEIHGVQASGGNLDTFVSGEYSSSFTIEFVRYE